MIRLLLPYALYSVVALVAIFLQAQVFSHLQIFNAKPDLLLLILVMSALKSDWKNGVAVGFLLGFWIDLINAAYFGMNMVVYGLVGAACGLVGHRFPDRTYEGYFFTAVGAAFLSGILTLICFQLAGASPPVGQSIFGTIFPMTFYTSLIAFLGLPLIYLYRHGRGRKIGRVDLLGNGIIYVRGNEKVDMEKVAARRAEARRRRQEHRQREQQRRAAAPRRGSRRPDTGRPTPLTPLQREPRRRTPPPRKTPPPRRQNGAIEDYRVSDRPAPRRDAPPSRRGTAERERPAAGARSRHNRNRRRR